MAGIKTFTCQRCKKTRQETIRALGLKPGTVIQDKKSNGVYKVNGDAATVSLIKPINKKQSSVTVPSSVSYQGLTCKVTAISTNAFKNNKYVKTLKIGDNVTSIGNDSFNGCEKLTAITFGKNVKTIGTNAFAKCTSVTKLEIPANVNSIGKQAFFGCKKLKNITIKTKKLTSKNVGTNAFKGVYSKPTITVPKAVFSSYKKLLSTKGIGSKAIYKKF